MNTTGLWTINANIQMLTGIILIVLLLLYIAYKLTFKNDSRPTRKTARS